MKSTRLPWSSPDEYSKSDSNDDLAEKQQLTAPYVVKAAKRAIACKHRSSLS